MQNLYNSALGVEYGQFYIIPDEDNFDVDAWDPDSAFENQQNGLCGAAVNGHVFFVTGIQNGTISVDVQLCEACPELDESYEEITEVSLTVNTLPVFLSEWGSEETHQLDLAEGSYRLRYSIDGMNKDYDDEVEGEEYWKSPLPGQRHLIQLWACEPGADQILKQTTSVAKYWHKQWGAAA